jgi:G3E family GTPase
MIKLDLITGFLGAGKTTFLKQYAKYLLGKDERICIIENDFGAINIDRVLLQDLEGDNCNLEMIVGGDGAEAHKRRLKTKLISMAMLGYNRVIIEPSGVFDVDEFFDLVYEEPLDRWYEIGNVIAILDPGVVKSLSVSSKKVLVSELAQAGAVLISRSEEYSKQIKDEAIEIVDQAMLELGCQHDLKEKLVMDKSFKSLDDTDYGRIIKCGFKQNSHKKVTTLGMDEYQTVFYFDFTMDSDKLKNALTELLNDNCCGNIHRVKGVVNTGEGNMVEINSTRYGMTTKPVNSERAILIVIGEDINVNELEKYLGKPTL